MIPGNTITGTWTRNQIGVYIFTSTGTFDGVKAALLISVSATQDNTFEFAVLNDNEITFNTYSAGAAQDGILDDLYVELIVHQV